MATHHVILECDWFVLGNQRLVKQIAFYDCNTNINFLYVFTFPRHLGRHSESFKRQSKHSHGIPWNKKGVFYLSDVCCVLQTIRQLIEAEDVMFWAKGEEKANILSQHGIMVNNLEGISCPKFSELSRLFPTTSNKARVLQSGIKVETFTFLFCRNHAFPLRYPNLHLSPDLQVSDRLDQHRSRLRHPLRLLPGERKWLRPRHLQRSSSHRGPHCQLASTRPERDLPGGGG